MPITFEECEFCGKNYMRVESNLKYNQSQDIFYYVWECFNCGKVRYVEAEPNEVENAEQKKRICLLCQRWNMLVHKYNTRELLNLFE